MTGARWRSSQNTPPGGSARPAIGNLFVRASESFPVEQLKKRMLVIDEAWNLMQYEDSAQFLYGLIKRARKYFLGVTTITQDVDDFINSPYGKPIISNTSLQILLKQSAASVDNLAKLFSRQARGVLGGNGDTR